MTSLLRGAAALLFLGFLQAEDATLADRAALAAFQRVSGLPHAVLIRRIQAEDGWDLVVAMASPRLGGGPSFWSTRERLGVLMQDRADPASVFTLVAEPGPNDDCLAARIEHLTARELVVSCLGKWPTFDYRKFVYDIPSRRLVSHFSYSPFATARILPGSRGPRFAMADNHRLLLVDLDDAGVPRVVPEAEARAALARIPMDSLSYGNETLRRPSAVPDLIVQFGPGGRFQLARAKSTLGFEEVVIAEGQGSDRKTYPLPRTDIATWQRARPGDVKSYLRPEMAEFDEQLGPHQLEGNRLWFGKTFYNAEGATGVGGFGYFDAAAAAFRLYSPPELYEWSVSAILVEPASVWLALYHRGEYGDSPGGLLRWDRKTSQVERFAVESIVTVFARSGDTLYLGAADGIVMLQGGRVGSYFVDRTEAGGYRMVAR